MTLFASPEASVQAIMAAALVLMGLSHITQPSMWRDFFGHLHGLGLAGVVFRTFAIELLPAVLIVSFHQVWTFPGIVLTIYGWLLLAKVVLSLLVPKVALRSLETAKTVTDFQWALAGILMIGLALTCAWSLLLALSSA